MKDQSKTKQTLTQKKASLNEAGEYADSIINTVREPLIVLDHDLRVVTASRSFYEFFKVNPEETEGQLIYNLGNDQWDIPKLRELLETILPQKTTFDNYEVEHDFATIGKRIMLLNARQIKRALGKERIILLAIEDITERRQLENILKESEERYRRLFETERDGIVFLEQREGKITHANPAIEKMLGYTEKEIIGNKLQDIGITLDMGDFQTTIQNLDKSGIINYRNVKVETKSGQNIDTEIYLVDRAKLVQCNIHDVTEHKKAEKALWESEEKYRWVLNNMADIIAVMDMNLRFTYVSPSIMRMRGYTVEEATAQTIEQVMTPESLQIVAKALEEEMKLEASGTADPGRNRTLELEQYKKDGSIVLIENHLSFMRDEAQKPVGIISLSHDITDRKRAEEALRQNEEKYRTILEDIQEGYFEVDFSGNFTFFNDSMCRLYGYSKEELMGMNYRHYTDKEHSKKLFQTFNKVYNTGEPTEEFGWQIIRKDGNKRYVETSVSLQKDSSDKPKGFRGIVRDVTERKRAEVKLRQQTDAMDAAIDGMAILNAEGEYVYLNKAHANVYGYDNAGELIGKSWRVLYDSDVIKYFDQEIMPEFSRKGYWHGESIGTKKNGSKFPQELSLMAMTNGGLICVVRDITDRKQVEQECQLSEERFRRIFNEGPFGMGLESPDHTIIAANKVLCELLGYTEQDLTGKSSTDITCEEDREKSKELLGQLFANSIPVIRSEKRYIKKDGDILWANTTVSAVHGQEGNVLYGLAIIEDLTDSRKSAEKIRLLAYYDSLTGLPNRTFHKELMKRAIEHAQRHKEIFALIYIGLDNFQRINDSLGYNIGDLLLKAVADRLTNSLRKSDYVARSDKGEIVNVVSRVGGDEFIVLAHDLNQAQDAAKMSRRLLEEMSTSYDLNGHEIFLTVSIGISLYPDDGTDVDELLKNAEKAMRHTKSEGKNNYHFYSSSMHASVLGLLTLESDLHKALERNELVLYYQPKVEAATGMIKGMEALIRWIHPDKGLIPPMQFIPMAETSGLIIPIGEFVIRTVCRQIKTWQEAGYKQVNVSLNVSGIQFDQQNLIEIVKDALQETMIPSQCLELEITESVLMRNPEKAIRILTELEAMGIGILIDDFGTGYSSLSYLKRLPALDFLKIDQSFVKSLASDPRDQAIVRATIAMAHSLNLKTIAEGVETQEQLSFLQEHGCDEIQGYLFSRPLPAEDIPGILAKGYL
jgi:diguanylate cyclase (GGDEF)-like protein/PAS domain S-box-containing protein